MNRYLKLLALSGGLVGAIAPTAIGLDTPKNNDLGGIYESVERIQNVLPRMSKINYQLNIASTEDDTVTFSTTNEEGETTNLTETETLDYLNETLQQVNIEYEQLKQVLNKAIIETMDYLEDYKNGETTLTNEQKMYIKEQTNSIKYLAETLEDLSEDVICAIDGCEEDDKSFELTASYYLKAIDGLEVRIQALQNAISSLQFIGGIGNPNFYQYRFFSFPNKDLENNNENNLNDELNTNPKDENSETADGALEVENNEPNTLQDNSQEQNQTNNENINAINENNNDESDKPTTFNLKSNIDTYAPTKRNIDTFFNTALYNNEYMNGGGYGSPYGYGGFGGYGMPYGHGYYGGYGNLNSNLVNREVLKNDTKDIKSPTAEINNETSKDTQKQQKNKPIRAKRAKNIDTYTQTTVQSNINTMGESKITSFFKQKFNDLKNKVRKQKDEVDSSQQLPPIVDELDDTQTYINEQNTNIDEKKIDTNNSLNIDSNNHSVSKVNNGIEYEKDINAR